MPDLGWVGFDPANCICTTDAHARVAIGLDYLGAAPVRGTRYGGGTETLTVTVKVDQAGRPGNRSGSRSRSCLRHCERRAKQSRVPRKTLDCFVAMLLAMTRVLQAHTVEPLAQRSLPPGGFAPRNAAFACFMIAVMCSITMRTAGVRPISRWNRSHNSWVRGDNGVGHADELRNGTRHDAGQNGKPHARAGGRHKVGEIVGSEHKAAIARQHFQPTLLRQMVEAVVVAEKIMGICTTTGQIIARPIEPVGNDGEFSRDQPFLDRRPHPERQIGFALAKADLARFADKFDTQAGMLSLNGRQARREKMGQQCRRSADPHDP